MSIHVWPDKIMKGTQEISNDEFIKELDAVKNNYCFMRITNTNINKSIVSNFPEITNYSTNKEFVIISTTSANELLSVLEKIVKEYETY